MALGKCKNIEIKKLLVYLSKEPLIWLLQLNCNKANHEGQTLGLQRWGNFRLGLWAECEL